MSPAIPTAVTLIGRHVAGAFRLRCGGLSLAKPAVHAFPAALRPKRSEDARSPSASPARSAGYDGASVSLAHIREYCELDETSKAVMRSAMNQLGMSAPPAARTTPCCLAQQASNHARHNLLPLKQEPGKGNKREDDYQRRDRGLRGADVVGAGAISDVTPTSEGVYTDWLQEAKRPTVERVGCCAKRMEISVD